MLQMLPAPWAELLEPAITEGTFNALGNRLVKLDEEKKLAPPGEQLFNALSLCSPSQLKVIVIGQDPYPNGEADGLCFSSPRITPSLRIIFKALEMQGFGVRKTTRLQDWADQGVLLINTILSTEPGKILAHKGIGWEGFTAHLMRAIAEKVTEPFVIMAWGAHAREIANTYFIRRTDLLILQSCHPQYMNYSGGKGDFFIHHMFQRTNDFLIKHQREPIYWNCEQPVQDFHAIYPGLFTAERSNALPSSP